VKTFKIVALLCILGLFTVDAFGQDLHHHRRWSWNYTSRDCNTTPTQPVGAPLDGGLLSILGVAGVGYYVMRKKKNSEKS